METGPAPERDPRPESLNPASAYIARVLGRPVQKHHERSDRLTAQARPPGPAPDALTEEPAPSYHAPATAEPAAWRRIPIGDDAELLIREDAYHRRRDKIDWLIDWARKVLG